MELVDHKDVETIIALYYLTRNVNIESVVLFTELTDVEPVQNDTPLNQQYGVQDSYTKVLSASIDRRLTVHRFDIDLDVGWVELCDYGETSTWANNPHNAPIVYNNLNLVNLDEVSNDINDEGMEDDDNVYTLFLKNYTRGIVICNDLEAHMLSIDPDAAHASEFSEYLDIIPSY
ncbi:hypothetical protein PVK06_012242 [Gossypium arboreum]|uniref:Uncharacterized protein n=1 Tax=Gossypium arboreum TaxID=29729 RepID=A0ABR0QC41_GOSAR|nr:hypothetical protein PVK06_012242 [Gossypium arboreum]